MTEYKLVTMGTGKSALTLCYLQDHFVANYEPTIVYSYVFKTYIDGKLCTLNILGTSSQEVYFTMKDQYWSGEGYIVVFGIDNYQSFEQVDHFITQVKRDQDTPMVLVINKIDLEKRRAVDNENN